MGSCKIVFMEWRSLLHTVLPRNVPKGLIIPIFIRRIPYICLCGNRSKERDRKSELVLRSTYQIFEWDRNNSDRNFYNVVRYVHIPLVP